MLGTLLFFTSAQVFRTKDIFRTEARLNILAFRESRLRFTRRLRNCGVGVRSGGIALLPARTNEECEQHKGEVAPSGGTAARTHVVFVVLFYRAEG